MKIDCFCIDDIEKVFTLDVYQKDEITFKLTHLPLDEIYVKSPGVKAHELKREQEIINMILSDKPVSGPRIFIIVGDTGTGKSEECRLIVETAKDTGRFVVEYKPKSLLAFGPLAFVGKEEIIYDLLKDSGKYGTILEILLPACKLLIEQQGYGNLWRELESKIKDGIKRRLIETIQSAEKLREKPEIEIKPFMLVESEDFKPFIQFERERLAKFLNERLASVLIAISTSSSSITGLLKRKIEEAQRQNKRYLLVMDDIVLVGEIFNDILNMISDIGQSNLSCDIVFGITRGRYADLSKILDTLSDRAYEIQMTNTNLLYQNASWLLSEQSAIELIKRYLKSIKDRNRCNMCKQKFCEQISSKDLFPFTEDFLYNFYSVFRNLAEKKVVALTPRFLLATLKLSLIYFLEKGKSPANRICEEWENVEGFIDPARTWLREGTPSWMKPFIRTCYFYGKVVKEKEKETIKVKKSIIDFFGFDLTDVQNYIDFIQEGDMLIISRERAVVKGEIRKEEPQFPDFDAIVNEIGRWMDSPNTSLAYTLEVKKGFNILLKELFKDNLRIIKNPGRRSAKGAYLKWRHRIEEAFPFSIGYGREKNEIKLLPSTLVSKEESPLILYVDKEDLVNLVKLGFNLEDNEAVSNFITKHPELVMISQKCADITFSQVAEEFLQWVLASLITLSQIYFVSSFGPPFDANNLYEITKEILSKRPKDPKELSQVAAIAFSLFTTRDSIIDYALVKSQLSKIENKDLISIVLDFDPEKIEPISKASNIVSNVKNIICNELRFINEEQINQKAKKYEEYLKIAKEILENYQDVKTELEKLAMLGERITLPEDTNFKKFIEDMLLIEKIANRERSGLENIILLKRMKKIEQDNKETLGFLRRIEEISLRSKEDYLKRYDELTKEIETLRKRNDELIDQILRILGE